MLLLHNNEITFLLKGGPLNIITYFFILSKNSAKSFSLILHSEGIYIKDKRIARVVETPLFSTLRRQEKVIIRSNWLPGPRINLTEIFKTFQTVAIVEQMRERMRQIKLIKSKASL